ncbi:MAG: hypothetical protein WBI57_09770 [Desulfobacterales bacterium]
MVERFIGWNPSDTAASMAKSFAVAVHFFENGIHNKFAWFIIRMHRNISARPVCMDDHTQYPDKQILNIES